MIGCRDTCYVEAAAAWEVVGTIPLSVAAECSPSITIIIIAIVQFTARPIMITINLGDSGIALEVNLLLEPIRLQSAPGFIRQPCTYKADKTSD